MSSIRNLIDDVYRKLKSRKSKSKPAKGEKMFSKKPVDPAEQKYKQERRSARVMSNVYDDGWDDFYSEYRAGNRDEAKRYLRKSRKKETTKDDINDRINSKREGEYKDMDLGYERRMRRNKKFRGSSNKELKNKGIDPNSFDEDIPF